MCWFHHAITAQHASPSAPVVWPRRRCRSALPQFRSEVSLFASMTCALRLSGGTVARQLSTSVSLIAERTYTHLGWRVTYSTRALHVRIIYGGAVSAHWRQRPGMISAGALDSH